MNKIILIISLLAFTLPYRVKSQSIDSVLIVDHKAYATIKDSTVQHGITASLKEFLKIKNNGSAGNPYIDPGYLKENLEPFVWLIDNESKMPNGQNFFKPTLLAVLKIDESSYFLKLAYMAVGIKTGKTPYLKMIATVVIKKSGANYFFYNAIDYNTRLWNVKNIGNIKYIYPNKFDMEKGMAMNKFNNSFAKKFQTQPLSITYYKCDDAEQMFKMLGYDYIENMYYATSSGLAEWWRNTLFAGNNSELYEHEAVHFYTNKLFPTRNKIVDEGYATFIGGSGGIPLAKLVASAKRYIKDNPNADICSLATNFEIRTDNNTVITYILSGLVCKDVEEKLGVAGIRKLFSPIKGEDYFVHLKKVNNIDKQAFPEYIKGLLEKYQ